MVVGALRDYILKWVRKFLGNANIEHGGGLDTGERPGDIIIYNWSNGRHLLIDFTIVDSLETHGDKTMADGPGAAATAAEKEKIKNYRHRLDPTKYIFIPFGMSVVIKNASVSVR